MELNIQQDCWDCGQRYLTVHHCAGKFSREHIIHTHYCEKNDKNTIIFYSKEKYLRCEVCKEFYQLVSHQPNGRVIISPFGSSGH